MIGRNSIKVGLISIHFPYNVVGFPSISYSSIPAWRNSDDYNDHNDYNDYNDYSDYNNYNDRCDYNDYRVNNLDLDLDWEQLSELVT